MAVIRRLRCGRVQLDFSLFGHRLRTNFREEAVAEEFRDRLLTVISPRQIGIAAAIDAYLKNETDKRKALRSRAVERLWFYELKHFLEHQAGLPKKAVVADVTRFHLESFQAHLVKNGSARGKPLTASSINRRFHSIKNLFSKLHEWGFTKHNPAKQIRKLPEKICRRRPWLEWEIVMILRSVLVPTTEKELIRFLLYTGIRLGSALDLKVSDVDIYERTIYVKQRKGDGDEQSYKVPISDSIYDLVVSKTQKNFDAFLFDDELGRPLSPGLISKRWQRISEKLGFPHLTLHGLRHTLASKLSAAGAPTEIVRQMLGHRSVKTTQRYTHAEFDHLRKWLK